MSIVPDDTGKLFTLLRKAVTGRLDGDATLGYPETGETVFVLSEHWKWGHSLLFCRDLVK